MTNRPQTGRRYRTAAPARGKREQPASRRGDRHLRQLAVSGVVLLAVVLAVPVLALYNGQRGPSPRVNTVMKWLFYLYYPAHLALIGWLQMQ